MPSKTQSIVIGGLVVGLLSTSILGLINVLCCAGVIIGALVSVWHYTETYDLTIEAGQGAVIGALAGLVGALIAAVLNAILATLGLDLSALVSDFVVSNFGNELSPEQLEQLQGGEQTVGAFILGTIVSLAVYAVFGAIGGAIGAAVFKKGGDAPSTTTTAPSSEPTV